MLTSDELCFALEWQNITFSAQGSALSQHPQMQMPPDLEQRTLSSSSLQSAHGIQRASSSAGLGKADSADASLEALLAELSSASATAAAALAPFTSPYTSQQAAESAPSVASPGIVAATHSPFTSSFQEVATMSESPSQSMTKAHLTVRNVSQLEASHRSSANHTASAPASSSLSARSSPPSPAAAPSAAASVSPLSPRSSSPLEDAQPGAQFVEKLQGEFRQHMAAFDDDLAFIQEVQTCRTLAAGMNPNVELQTLHKRFNNWKFDFKVRTACTAPTAAATPYIQAH